MSIAKRILEGYATRRRSSGHRQRPKRVSKNDFRQDENKTSSPYRIWLAFKPEAIGKLGGKIRRPTLTRYAYNTKSRSEALQQLIDAFAVRYAPYLKRIRLYDNQVEPGEDEEDLIQEWKEDEIVKYFFHDSEG